ncbi:MAG: cytochrome P450, partial [Acidimicrobiaceae bacterium]|nr:cytochrome P450 [Acidimicrobiaceae bacterium]
MSAALRILDLSSYETFVNGFPHDAFLHLREQAPVWWHEPTERTPDGEGFWCVCTHELVEVFWTPRVYSSHTGGDRAHGGTMINDMEMSGKLLNMMDDPRHQRIRRLVRNGFTPKRIARLRSELEAMSPEQLEALRADRSLMPAAIEEIVRWSTPSVHKRRTATTDTVLGGHWIRSGDKVVVWEMSANRDDAVFDRPFEFRIDRNPNAHVGFGHGPRFCLGAKLARLEIEVMLNA